MQFQQAPEENFNTYLQLDELDCDKHMLVINDGQQYLSLRKKHASFQFLCKDNDPSCQGNHFCINLNIMDGADKKIARIQQLMRLFNKTKEPLPRPLPEQKLKLFKECLQAVHAWHNGESYRETALIFFGEERVREEWSDNACILKNYVRFRVKKGFSLMNGGYRDLL